MAIRDIDPGESGWQYVTLTKVSQVAIPDIVPGESGWQYVTLTRVSQDGITSN